MAHEHADATGLGVQALEKLSHACFLSLERLLLTSRKRSLHWLQQEVAWLRVLSLQVWNLEGQFSASEDLKERPREGTVPLPSKD